MRLWQKLFQRLSRRRLAFEALEGRLLLAFENLAQVQANENPGAKVQSLLRYRLGHDNAEWSIANTLANPRGYGFGLSLDSDGAAGSLNTSQFLNDTPIAGDWTGLGTSNFGSVRWQKGATESKRIWAYYLAVNRDAHVDKSYAFPVDFDIRDTEDNLPIPLAGDLDGRNGADLAIVDKIVGQSNWRWYMAMEQPGPSISFARTQADISFGPVTAKPVLGYYQSAPLDKNNRPLP